MVIQKLDYQLSEIQRVAEALLEYPQKIFVFDAPMGAGKTTLISALCQQLGIAENISSPTFSLVNVYENKAFRVYHYDLYRLKNSEELLDIGFEDYLADHQAYHFIEWPEKALSLIEENYLYLNIKTKDQYTRCLVISQK